MAIAVAEVFVPKQVDPLSKQYGEALRALRQEKRLKHRELAESLGIAESTYRAYEQGYRRIRLDQIQGFAEAYGISQEELSARLGLGTANVRELRVAECAELMRELDHQPPEVAETLLRWFRESIALHRRRRLESEN